MNTNPFKSKALGIILSLAMILSMAAVALPVSPVHAAVTYYVDGALGTDDGSHGTSSGAGAFKTIQYAISDVRVVATDTIIVAAGTYTGDLTISKGIIVRSASGSATTIIQLVDGVGIDISANSAKLGGSSGAGFTVTPHATATTFAIQVSGGVSGVEISYNTIGTTGTASQAISVAAAGATGLTVSTNTITLDAGDVAVDCNGPIATMTVSGNTITGPADGNANSVSFYECTVSTATISNNIITAATSQIRLGATAAGSVTGITYSGNSFTGTQGGILVLEPTEAAAQRLTNLSVTRNTFANGTPDTFSFMLLSTVEAGDVDFTTIAVNYNSFPARRNGTDTFASVTNDTGGGSLNAETNWWGQSTGPVIAGGTAQVSTNVDYTPWSQCVIIYPNLATDRLKGGTAYNIQWTSYASTSATATLYYSTSGGTSYTPIGTIGSPLQGLNSYSWTVPAISNATCKVKVTVTDGSLSYSGESAASFTIDSIAPTVNLGPPVGGECWIGSSAHTVTWVGTDNLPGTLDYTLQYSATGSDPWTTFYSLADQAWGTQSYAWTVPAGNASTYKVRVTAQEHNCALNTTTYPSPAFTIDSIAPTVSVTYPVGGETVNTGSTMLITWNATDNLPGNLTYAIELSTDGGGTYPTSIVSGLAAAQGSNTYTWTVSSANSSLCRIRVTAADCAGSTATSASAANFTISDITPPTVTVTSPAGGESWAAGSTQTITWTATDNVPGNLTYYLYYCTSYTACDTCSVPITTLAGQPQGSRSYTWTVATPVPPATVNTCRIHITATDAASNTGSACSTSNFTIRMGDSPPTVTLSSPNGGQTWQSGTSNAITWNTASSVPNDVLSILLQYSADGGGSWNNMVTLSNRDPGAGTFYWSPPNTAGSLYMIKVTATGSGGSASAQSASTFTVTAADAGVTTFPIVLSAGWNMISLQAMPATGYVESVLASQLPNVSRVLYYDTSSGIWQRWASGAPSSLSVMTDGKAYFVNVTSGCTINYLGRKCPGAGTLPPNYTYIPGWNMVGFKSTGVATTVATYLGATGYVSPVYKWDPASGYVSVTSATNMIPTLGYFVNFTSTTSVIPGCD